MTTETQSFPVVVTNLENPIPVTGELSVNGRKLVKVPVNRVPWQSTAYAASTVAFSQNSFFDINGGSFSSINMVNPANTVFVAKASFIAVVYGRTIGIRFKKSTTTTNFSVIVDGVAYGLSQNNIQSQWQNLAMILDKEASYIMVTGLPDGKHDVEVVLPPATGNTGMEFLGFLLEEEAGYREINKIDYPANSGTVTTTNVSVPTLDTSTINTNTIRGIKSILYYNNETDPAKVRKVTVMYGGKNIWSASIPASSWARFDTTALGVTPIGLGGADMKHMCDLDPTAPENGITFLIYATAQ